MARGKKPASDVGPQSRLESLVKEALDVTKKARRHSKSLTGDNFYASKLAELRTEATNCFNELSAPSVGDTSALAEMVGTVFDAGTAQKIRLSTARNLLHSLGTTWRRIAAAPADELDAVFPAGLLSNTRRGYLIAVGRQMNGSFARGWYDASAVMMRRLLETAIIEAFEAKQAAVSIKGANGDYLHLSELIDKALNTPAWTLTRNTKDALPRLRDLGHLSAHSRRYTAQKSDIEKAHAHIRVAVEEFLHLAGLL